MFYSYLTIFNKYGSNIAKYLTKYFLAFFAFGSSISFATFEQVTFETIPLLPKFSTSHLSERITIDIKRIPEIKELQNFAEHEGIRIFLIGKSAADLAHRSRIELLKESLNEEITPSLALDYLSRPGQPIHLGIIHPFLAETLPLYKNILKAEIEAILPVEVTVTDLKNLSSNESLTNLSSSLILDIKTGTLECSSNFKIIQALASGKLGRSAFFPYLTANSAIHLRENDENAFLTLSAIRILSIAFRYGLELDLDLITEIKSIISRSDKTLWSDFFQKAIENEGTELFLDALDLEDAWNILDYSGARKTLIEISDIRQPGTFSYFLCKEPLRSLPHPCQARINKPSFLGHLCKASQIDIKYLTHNTSVRAYQEITSHPANKINAFISRDNLWGNPSPDEYAVHGAGFYTVIGKTGNISYGPKSVVMEVSPQARQNLHFISVPSRSYCRLLSSDPDFVRGTASKKDPFYRPYFHSKSLFNHPPTEAGTSQLEKLFLRCLARFRK